MGIGAITVPTVTAITAPTTFRFVTPSANSKSVYGYGIYSAIKYPGGRGTMFGNGCDPLYHVLTDTVLRTGLLAPADPARAICSGQQATATLNLDVTTASPYNPTDGDLIGLAGTLIAFVTAFGTSNYQVEIMRGATTYDTLLNLQRWQEQTGVPGVHYEAVSYVAPSPDVEVVSVTQATSIMVFRIKTAGTYGNGIQAYLDQNAAGGWGGNPSTDASFGSTGTTVGTIGYFSGGVDGTDAGNSADDQFTRGFYDYRYSYYRREDGATSGISPADFDETYGLAFQAGDFTVAVDQIDNPFSDDDIDYQRAWRTQPGGNVFYRLAEFQGTTYTDSLGNNTLSQRLTYDPLIHRTWEAGFISRVRYLAEYEGRWFGGGIIPSATYSRGTADVTNGGYIVYLNSGYPTKAMEHRTFRIVDASSNDAAAEYEIIMVDEVNQALYLDRKYEGTSSGSTPVYYEILDTRDPYTLYYCEPVLPNQTGPQMELTSVQGRDPDGITGVYAAFESLFVFTKTGIWRLTGTNATSFRLTQVYDGVGCVSGHTIVLVDGVLYWVGLDGIYAWTGSGEPYKASSPPSQSLGDVRGIQRTVSRINPSHAHTSFGHFDPENRLIRWFVPLDDEITNSHALVFDVQTKSWAVDTAPDITYCSSVLDEGGDLITLAGDVNGNLWQLDVGTSDGAYGVAPTGWTVDTGATMRTIPLTTTGLPDLTGVTIYLVNATTGTFTEARVASNTTGTIYTTEFLDSAPSSGTSVVLGAIHSQVESGRFTYDAPSHYKILEAVKVCFAVATQGRWWLSYAADQGTATVPTDYVTGLDPTVTDGEDIFWIRDIGKRFKLRFDSITPGGNAALQSFDMWLRIRDGSPVNA